MRQMVGVRTTLDRMLPARSHCTPSLAGPRDGTAAQKTSRYAGMSHRMSTYPPPVPICGKIAYSTKNAAAESPSVVRQLLTGFARTYSAIATTYVAIIGSACAAE